MKPESISMLSELEVFILTYNRYDLLKIAVESIVKQTAGVVKLSIIDNGSTDNTSEILADFKEYAIGYIKNDINRPALEVYDLIRSLVRSKYIMIFHDDDVMHPRYLQFVFDELSRNPDLVVIGTVFESFYKDEEVINDRNWVLVNSLQEQDISRFDTSADLAAFFYQGHQYHFAATVYSTDAFKTVTLRQEAYGKICDRPYVLEIASRGRSLAFNIPLIKYRIHQQQDSSDSKSGPYLNEISNLHKLYHHLLGDNPFLMNGRAFLRNNFRYMNSDYRYLRKNKMIEYSKSVFLFKQLKEGATSLPALLFGPLFALQNLFISKFWKFKNGIARFYYNFISTNSK